MLSKNEKDCITRNSVRNSYGERERERNDQKINEDIENWVENKKFRKKHLWRKKVREINIERGDRGTEIEIFKEETTVMWKMLRQSE